MPWDSVICRKNLDESRGNPWICECYLCKKERTNNDGRNKPVHDGEGDSGVPSTETTRRLSDGEDEEHPFQTG